MDYIYSISVDTATGQLDSAKLLGEIEASSVVTTVTQIDTSGNTMYIKFSSALSVDEKTTLDGLVAAHDGSVPLVIEPTSVSVVNQIYQSAFADKITWEGTKLFRRKHGSAWTSVAPNSSQIISLTVPYNSAKINKAEILGCREGDSVNLCVHDSVNGDYTGVPDYILSQFGFSVAMPDGFYVDKSEYDADLYIGMQIKVEYTNNSSETRNVAVNFTLHELVPES